MAIAYYIPDQAKLLGGHAPNRGTEADRSNHGLPSSANEARSPQPDAASSSPSSRGYGTSISVTVPANASPQESAGCWDFLTQVFCHALRFCNESSQLQPAVIQISVNFQSQAAQPRSAAQEPSSSAASPADGQAASEPPAAAPAAGATPAPANKGPTAKPAKSTKKAKRRN